MPVTINADTATGAAVVTADASGVLALQAAGNTGLTLNTSLALGVGSGNSTGTTGQVLTSAGSGAAPTWGDIESTPVGSLQYFAGPTTSTYPGSSWLQANGAVLTQTSYAALFSTIGLIQNGVYDWTARTSGTTTSILALTHGNGVYVYGGASLVGYSSNNGATWTSYNVANRDVTALAYNAGLYVFADSSGGIRTATDVTDASFWAIQTSGTTSSIRALIYANGLYVYAGAGGALATSTNAVTWTARTSGTTSSINALTYVKGLYVYGGFAGILRTSTDAITWTARTSGTTSSINALTYGNGLYVYGGVGGVLRTSTDAITWTARTSGTTSAISALIYDSGVYVASTGAAGSASSGSILTSTNGINWAIRPNPTVSPINALTYGVNQYMYGGGNGTVGTAPQYTYNTATEFVLPTQTAAIDAEQTRLYIKAT